MSTETIDTTDTPVPEVDEATASAAVAEDGLVAEELLVEEISIDGMCGVY
ncbi:MAG: mycofactocin precursor MftA [Acidimicrobiales bacterium]